MKRLQFLLRIGGFIAIIIAGIIVVSPQSVTADCCYWDGDATVAIDWTGCEYQDCPEDYRVRCWIKIRQWLYDENDITCDEEINCSDDRIECRPDCGANYVYTQKGNCDSETLTERYVELAICFGLESCNYPPVHNGCFCNHCETTGTGHAYVETGTENCP